MSEKVSLFEVRLHSYGCKAMIREKDDGNWSVGLLFPQAMDYLNSPNPVTKRPRILRIMSFRNTIRAAPIVESGRSSRGRHLRYCNLVLKP